MVRDRACPSSPSFVLGSSGLVPCTGRIDICGEWSADCGRYLLFFPFFSSSARPLMGTPERWGCGALLSPFPFPVFRYRTTTARLPVEPVSPPLFTAQIGAMQAMAAGSTCRLPPFFFLVSPPLSCTSAYRDTHLRRPLRDGSLPPPLRSKANAKEEKRDVQFLSPLPESSHPQPVRKG